MTMSTYLIIGGSSSIGSTIIKNLLNSGHNVYASYYQTEIKISHGRLNTFKWETKKEWNPENVPIDSIDGIVYCPGAINLKPFHRIGIEDFHQDLEIQVFGAIKIIQSNLKQLKKSLHASIVLISSIAVQRGFPFHSLVGVSKGAIEGLVKNLAAEFSPNIRVNGIAPSIIESKMSARLLNSDEKRDRIAANHPLKRIGKPDDVGNIASFLLSDDSSWITGQIISVDGGKSNILS